jgi:chromosome segregation ATPase
MACDICGGNSPLHCITCARSAIELPRIELAKTLIERDEIGRYVRAVAEGLENKSLQHVSLTDSKGGLLVDREEASKNVDLQRMKAETAEIKERTQLAVDCSASLQKEMDATRQQIEARRAQIAQRKSDLSSMTYGIETRRANEADKVQQNIKRMDYKLDRAHHETVEMRAYLCNTAARLAGVKMTRRRTKDGGIREVYSIGPGSRLRIYDLRDLHGMFLVGKSLFNLC